MTIKNIINLPNLTLFTALTLSAIAAWYSIVGLTAIFAAAVIPIIIMGSALEIAKVVTTVWLHKYWSKASLALKLYLVPALIVLAFLTSMGIFGFLSKAHMDQGVPTGDVAAKVALIDEKIKTERENIELARKALQQMDAQVDARLSRGESEAGAERAVQIRRQQQGERAKLQKDIGDAQKKIAALNEERAPIASELRKVEAEVGPIKYIAALIYGDNPDNDLLERAVRWVIIIIVAVFDPLALTLVIAATSSRNWFKEEDSKPVDTKPDDVLLPNEPEVRSEEETVEPDKDVWPFPDIIKTETIMPEKFEEVKDKYEYLKKPFQHFKNLVPMVYKPEKKEEVENVVETTDNTIEFKQPEETVEPVESTETKPVDIVSQPTIEVEQQTYKELDGGYIDFEGKSMKLEALKEMRPDLFRLTADSTNQASTNFGIKFPTFAKKSDIFVRVDVLPNKVFKFDGKKWIEINKEVSDSYLYDQNYIRYLVEKIEKGEIDIELLSDKEKSSIEDFLKKQ
jgi:hypothetical protein